MRPSETQQRGFNSTPERRQRKMVDGSERPESTRCQRCGVFPSWRSKAETVRLCQDCRREDLP